MAYPQSIAIHPQFAILDVSFSIPLPQISLIKPQISIFNSSSSIVSQKNVIFDSKSPQNSGIFNKMSPSTACSFIQVCSNQPSTTHNKLLKWFHKLFPKKIQIWIHNFMTPTNRKLAPLLENIKSKQILDR